MTNSRRDFLEQSVGSVAATAASLYVAGASAQEQTSKDTNRLAVAVIGPGGMGTAHTNQLAKNSSVHVAYICDVDANRAAKAAETITQQTGVAPKVVSDLRRVLDDKNVKAVWIATPDHWHAPAAILAANAGKHVYVEKPCSHNLREGRLMIEAARKNNVVMQVGTQCRSTRFIAEAIDKLKTGIIGEILAAQLLAHLGVALAVLAVAFGAGLFPVGGGIRAVERESEGGESEDKQAMEVGHGGWVWG